MTAFPPFFASRRAAFSVFLAALALAGTALPATAQTPPTIVYSPQGDRQLIFVNNPERIELDYTDTIPGSATQNVLYNDLGDAALGKKALLKILLPPGKYRDSFEHVWNFGRRNTTPEGGRAVNYGVVLRNPSTNDVTVTMRGKGFVNNANGNAPFVELFNRPTVQTVTIRPGSFVWLLRTDADYGNTRSVPSGNFFSGVVDFDFAGAPCELVNVVYQSSAAVTGTVTSPKAIIGSDATVRQLDYTGYVTRRYSTDPFTPAPESRVYKGLMMAPNTETSGSDVLTAPTFTISDATPAGELPVVYPQYLRNTATGQHEPSATLVTGTFWLTHNSPLRDNATRRVVASDMFDTEMPGFGTVFALRDVVSPNTTLRQANIANWSVVYRDRVTVVNNGSVPRNVSLTLANQGGGAPVAYQANDGTWQRTGLTTTPFAYRTFTVPAGQSVTVEGVFTLGAPAVGTVRHAVQVTNAAPPAMSPVRSDVPRTVAF